MDDRRVSPRNIAPAFWVLALVLHNNAKRNLRGVFSTHAELALTYIDIFVIIVAQRRGIFLGDAFCP